MIALFNRNASKLRKLPRKNSSHETVFSVKETDLAPLSPTLLFTKQALRIPIVRRPLLGTAKKKSSMVTNTVFWLSHGLIEALSRSREHPVIGFGYTSVLLQVLRDPQEHRQVDRSCSLHDTLASDVHSGSADRFGLRSAGILCGTGKAC